MKLLNISDSKQCFQACSITNLSTNCELQVADLSIIYLCAIFNIDNLSKEIIHLQRYFVQEAVRTHNIVLILKTDI